MIAETWLRWLLSVAFAAYAAHCVYRCGRDRTPVLVVGDVAHVLMALGMIAMTWPWGMGLPRTPQVVAFTLGGLWFCLQLARRDPAHRDVCGRQGLALHAGMMAAMVWMVVAMPSTMAGGMSDDMAASRSMPGTGSMPGMSMPGAAGPSTAVVLTAVALGVLFLASGAVWLMRAAGMVRALAAADGRWRPRLPEVTVAADGVMSLGMGLMALLMA